MPPKRNNRPSRSPRMNIPSLVSSKTKTMSVRLPSSKPRRRRKSRSSLVSSREPLAVNTTFRPQFDVRSSGQGCFVTGSELLAVKPISNGQTHVMPVFCNPALLNDTRLSTIASVYQNYRPVKFCIRYVTSYATTKPGNCAVGTTWQNDSYDVSSFYSALAGSPGGMITTLRNSFVSQVPLTGRLSQALYFLQRGVSDDGNPFTWWFTSSDLDADVSPGYFVLDYCYHFSNPTSVPIQLSVVYSSDAESGNSIFGFTLARFLSAVYPIAVDALFLLLQWGTDALGRALGLGSTYRVRPNESNLTGDDDLVEVIDDSGVSYNVPNTSLGIAIVNRGNPASVPPLVFTYEAPDIGRITTHRIVFAFYTPLQAVVVSAVQVVWPTTSGSAVLDGTTVDWTFTHDTKTCVRDSNAAATQYMGMICAITCSAPGLISPRVMKVGLEYDDTHCVELGYYADPELNTFVAKFYTFLHGKAVDGPIYYWPSLPMVMGPTLRPIWTTATPFSDSELSPPTDSQ